MEAAYGSWGTNGCVGIDTGLGCIGEPSNVDSLIT
jgi:hypothetical protein